MPTEISAGGVVYTSDSGQPLILLILDIYGHWTLPKGHVEPGETPQQAAIREIEEEVGLEGKIEQELGETSYQYRRDSEVVDKIVRYYLVKAPRAELTLAPGEIRDARWLPLDLVLSTSDYDNNRPLLEKAIELLRATAR